MSFHELTKPQLLEVAEAFGIEVDARKSARNIVAEIVSDGVTWEMYQESVGAVEREAEMNDFESVDDTPAHTAQPRVESADQAFGRPTVSLVKMVRSNPTFEIRGYRFTKTHPYALVKNEDVDFILNTTGFRIATPNEVAEFYS